MTQGSSVFVFVGWVLLTLVFFGCSADDDAVARSPTVPTLLTPVNNMVIGQNKPDIGCPSHPTCGFGCRIFFDWTDAESPAGIAGYHLIAQQRNALFPLVDTFVTHSEFTALSCNAFVLDAAGQGWEWRVQAEDPLGNVSPWTETEVFQFAPCRLANGNPCNAAF